jgi:hypothetical protein
VERAKRLNIAFVFAVVLALAFFFCVFSPKNACQAQKPPNSLKQKKIELQVSYPQTAIIKIVEKNKQAPPGYNHPPGLTRFNAIFWTQPICYEYFTDTDHP